MHKARATRTTTGRYRPSASRALFVSSATLPRLILSARIGNTGNPGCSRQASPQQGPAQSRKQHEAFPRSWRHHWPEDHWPGSAVQSPTSPIGRREQKKPYNRRFFNIRDRSSQLIAARLVSTRIRRSPSPTETLVWGGGGVNSPTNAVHLPDLEIGLANLDLLGKRIYRRNRSIC